MSFVAAAGARMDSSNIGSVLSSFGFVVTLVVTLIAMKDDRNRIARKSKKMPPTIRNMVIFF